MIRCTQGVLPESRLPQGSSEVYSQNFFDGVSTSESDDSVTACEIASFERAHCSAWVLPGSSNV